MAHSSTFDSSSTAYRGSSKEKLWSTELGNPIEQVDRVPPRLPTGPLLVS
jgi:hypothetical protein